MSIPFNAILSVFRTNAFESWKSSRGSPWGRVYCWFYVISLNLSPFVTKYRYQNHLQMSIIWYSIIFVPFLCRKYRNSDGKNLFMSRIRFVYFYHMLRSKWIGLVLIFWLLVQDSSFFFVLASSHDLSGYIDKAEIWIRNESLYCSKLLR